MRLSLVGCGYVGQAIAQQLQGRADLELTVTTTSEERRDELSAIADQVFAGVQGYMPPEAGFFLWLPVEDGEQAALKLWQETGVRVLPGAPSTSLGRAMKERVLRSRKGGLHGRHFVI